MALKPTFSVLLLLGAVSAQSIPNISDTIQAAMAAQNITESVN